MFDKLLKFSFVIVISLFIGILYPMQTHAALESSGSSYDSFKLDLKDFENSIEKFSITPLSSPNIFDDILFDRNGESVRIDFKYYKNSNDETYLIPINLNNTPDTIPYGGDYVISDVDKIIVLPSKITITDNQLLFSRIANETLELDLKYINSSSGSRKNRIRTAPHIKKNEDGDSIKWDVENTKLDINLEIEIPIKLRDESLREEKEGTKYGVLANSSTSPGDIIVDSVTATIKVQNNSITFDPGWNQVSNLNDKFAEAEAEQILKEIENKTRRPLPEDEKGFSSGAGITLLSNNTYKGISTEMDFEQFLIGITNFVLTFVSVIAVLMLIYGGFLWITDQGDDQQSEKAKKVIAGAIIGILIIVSAYTIVNTVIDLEGETCDIGFARGGMQADCNFEGNAATTAGIGSLIGGAIGGNDGTMVGGLLGGLLGGG